MFYYNLNLSLLSIIFLYKLNNYVKKYYPVYYEKCVISISYNAIYYFTGVNLFVKNITKRTSFIKNKLNTFISPDIVYDLEFVKNGKLVLQTNIKTLTMDDTYINMDYDFIIHNDNLINDTNQPLIVNKTIFYEIPKINVFKSVDYKFIMTKLITHTGVIVDLRLFSDKFNYFVLNNVITKKVILYLLRTNHTDVLISDDDLKDYKLMVIDQHANLLYIQHNQSISFGKHNYDILDIQSEIEIASDYLLKCVDN